MIYRKAKVGAVYWDAPRHVAVFEYTPEFIATAPKLKGIISQVSGALTNWEAYAAEAGVGDHEARQIKTALTKQAHQTAAG